MPPSKPVRSWSVQEWQHSLWNDGLWELESTRTFTCKCGEKRIVPQDALKQIKLEDGTEQLALDESYFRPCDKCGRGLFEIMAFGTRYGLLPKVRRPPRGGKKEKWVQLTWLALGLCLMLSGCLRVCPTHEGKPIVKCGCHLQDSSAAGREESDEWMDGHAPGTVSGHAVRVP
jgi:hypothetical protein